MDNKELYLYNMLEEIKTFMRNNCGLYILFTTRIKRFKRVNKLKNYS